MSKDSKFPEIKPLDGAILFVAVLFCHLMHWNDIAILVGISLLLWIGRAICLFELKHKVLKIDVGFSISTKGLNELRSGKAIQTTAVAYAHPITTEVTFNVTNPIKDEPDEGEQDYAQAS